MKKFHDPIAPREKKVMVKPWSFSAPSYDNRSGDSVQAGADYGVGFRTPVGKEKATSKGPIPMESKCWNPNEIVKDEVQG